MQLIKVIAVLLLIGEIAYAQPSLFSTEERLRKIEKETEPLRILVEDIRRAVYASEEDLKECLPKFTSASITLEGSHERDAGIELNFVVFKITSKKKKGRTDKSTITFVRDDNFKPMIILSREGANENFNIIRNLIVSQGFANCISSNSKVNLSDNLKNPTIPYSIYEIEIPTNPTPKVVEEILSKAFKTQKLEVEISFIVEKELGIEGGFKITPISGSVKGNLKHKNVQTVKVIFGKDPV